MVQLIGGKIYILVIATAKIFMIIWIKDNDWQVVIPILASEATIFNILGIWWWIKCIFCF